MLHRLFLVICLCFSIVPMAQAQNSAKKLTPEVQFVQGMADTGIAFLADASLSLEQRKQEFGSLLNEYFDVKTIARFAIGEHWKAMSDEQKERYLKNFETYLVNVYSRRFQDYKGQSFEAQKSISASSTTNNDVFVTSFLTPESGAVIQIDWRVREKDGQYKVIDIIVSGVSMTITQRSDFSSVIQRNGGDINKFLAFLTKHNKENVVAE